MTTLLETANVGMSAQQERLLRLGLRDLYKLKYKHDASRESFEKMQFELKLISNLIESLKPRSVEVYVDQSEMRQARGNELEFDPTFTGPNIIIEDEIGRNYSFWYKPKIYVPITNGCKALVLDFVMLKGLPKKLYNLDDSIKVELEAYEFLPTELVRELALKLMQKMKPLHMVLQCKNKFRNQDLVEAKDIAFFLKPRQFAIASEDYIPSDLKINLPFSVTYVENIDMNTDKFTDFVKKII